MNRLLLLIPVLSAYGWAGEVGDPVDVALRKLQPVSGIKADVFAAEPDVTNPVGIWVDDRGRVFLAETRRYNTAALYVKQRPTWYYDDLACRKVEDRIVMARKFMGDGFSVLTEKSEVVRLLEDRNGDGRSDSSVVFAEGFNDAADGVASGVLVRGNDVWLANVPKLWKLRDSDNDGRADERKVLQDGYGTRFGNSGHDLHGLVWGPEGKLYFSMGDRGLHVETEGKTFAYPDTGAVLRCNPDGSNFEVFAYGLRNQQGMAFDDFGNLFTADNNADVGDDARWVHVVDGGDSGWRTGFQYASDPWAHQPIVPGMYLVNNRNSPWMTENLWKGEAPYTVPPCGFVSRGPCGLTAYPGTGLSERYQNAFFLCDFPGGIFAFKNAPKGASFELQDVHKFLWECWPTDAKFGPDGKLYICDWVYGFPMTGKGRVFRAFDPGFEKDPAVAEVRKLLREGFAQRPAPELASLLAHRDRRIRQEAQFELARRKETALLETAARDGTTQLARVHGIWGLWQLEKPTALLPLLKDNDAEIRAQACRVLGELRVKEAAAPLLASLKDTQPRVRMSAALALARIGAKEAFAPLLELLRENNNIDAYVRHAGVMGLVGCGSVDLLTNAARDPSPAVRMGVLLALRRMERSEIRVFLSDSDPALVLEAARAINDVPIASEMPALAALLERTDLPHGALLRAINANFRLGTFVETARLAKFAARADAPGVLRAEALGALAAWGKPSQRDRVATLWRPLPPRDGASALAALEPLLPALLTDTSDDVRIAALRAIAGLNIRCVDAAIETLARESKNPSAVRIEALRAITKLHTAGFEATVTLLASDSDAAVRKESIALVPQLRRPEAAEALVKLALSNAEDDIRQAAIAALGRIEGEASNRALGALLDELRAKTLKPSLALDVLEAAGSRGAFKERLTSYEAGLPQDDEIAASRVALEGGDPLRGRKVFFENASAACLRCHKVKKEGGDVGPPLTTVGKDRSRVEILESILLPNKMIVEGYGQETVVTKSEGPQVGRVKSEDATHVVLVLADATEKKIAKDDIRRRRPALSAMPEDMGKLLTKRELRDLVAFLAGLR